MTTASYIGKVNSPANADPIGKNGTSKIPIITAVAATTPKFFVVKLANAESITIKVPKQITLNVIRYFLYLSSITPNTIELITPNSTNSPPKILTYPELKPIASKKGSKTTPKAMNIPSSAMNETKSS
jgi:hypothetical protein